MDITHSVVIDAPRNRVFALYSDVTSWPAWDGEVAAVTLPGLFPGASGWLKPRHGPKAGIEVVEMAQDASFTIESRLPLCRMRFGHELTDDRDRTVATHWVRFTGPLAFVFRKVIGRGIDMSLPQTLAGLKRAAEKTE